MNRRDTLVALLALGAAPFAVRAQPAHPARPFRIGLLPGFPGNDDYYRKWVAGAMREMGWIEGRDFSLFSSGLEYRTDQMEADARRAVAENPDLILAVNDGYGIAAHRLTTTIPIVMWGGGDPVLAGLANSLARPGKNVTGNSIYAGTGVFGKFVELLRDAKPGVERIGVLWDYVPPFCSREEGESALQQIRHAARVYGMALRIAEVSFPDRAPAAMAEIEAARPDALIASSGPGLGPWRQRVAQFAVETRLPLIVDFRWGPSDPYPMLVYAPSRDDLMRRAVSYVDRILKGAKPGDLPIQQPSKFELVVNLKAAKDIGLTIAQLLLLRADEVIE